MRVCHSCVTRARISASLSARSRSVAQRRRAARPARRSRARRRGCSCAAPRSGARSAPARCRRAASVCAIVGGADAGARPGARSVIASEPSCRWPWRSWCVAPAHVVAVLGDVGQVREVAEGADHADRLVARQVLQQPVERAAGAARRSSAGRPPRAGARARSARRRPCPPARGSRRRGCGRAGGCPRPAGGSSRRRRAPQRHARGRMRVFGGERVMASDVAVAGDGRSAAGGVAASAMRSGQSGRPSRCKTRARPSVSRGRTRRPRGAVASLRTVRRRTARERTEAEPARNVA